MIILRDLKEGDIITILYAGKFRTAKVLANYPNKDSIYLRVYFFWGLVWHSEMFYYCSHNFRMINEKPV